MVTAPQSLFRVSCAPRISRSNTQVLSGARPPVSGSSIWVSKSCNDFGPGAPFSPIASFAGSLLTRPHAWISSPENVNVVLKTVSDLSMLTPITSTSEILVRRSSGSGRHASAWVTNW